MTLPATMTAEEAAFELHMTVWQFRGAVRRRELPGPFTKTRPHLWAGVQIEKALAGEGVIRVHSEGADSIMERLRERLDGGGKSEIR